MTGWSIAIPYREVNTETTQAFLDAAARRLRRREHAVMSLDGAGWHRSHKLRWPRPLRAVFDTFYADSSAGVIFDTSRAWCGWTPAVARLLPEAKVIACVRDVAWIVSSIEKLVQRNVFSPSSIVNYDAGGTVYTRANSVATANGMVGGPYDALKQACYGAQRDRLILV